MKKIKNMNKNFSMMDIIEEVFDDDEVNFVEVLNDN